MPLSRLFDGRAYVWSSEGLRREKQGISWGSGRRRNSTFMALSRLFNVRVHVGGRQESALGGARNSLWG